MENYLLNVILSESEVSFIQTKTDSSDMKNYCPQNDVKPRHTERKRSIFFKWKMENLCHLEGVKRPKDLY